MRNRILLIEDDQALAKVVADSLAMDGFEVQCVGDGDRALPGARSFAPDLILLDLMLPGRGGFDLCGVLRQQVGAPIIILSARGQKADKLRGLQTGADDYLTKPFDLDELIARIHVVLRRRHSAVERLKFGKVLIDFAAQRATYGGREIHLTQREFDVLRYLAERQDRVVYRSELLRDIWGYAEAPTATRSVDQAIVRLRRKLELDPQHRLIRTVHGDGYRLSSIEADK
jgi:DNA-binding response OmpR family regulator